MTISQFYNKILTELRADPQYFRVSFFGGFPPFFKVRRAPTTYASSLFIRSLDVLWICAVSCKWCLCSCCACRTGSLCFAAWSMRSWPVFRNVSPPCSPTPRCDTAACIISALCVLLSVLCVCTYVRTYIRTRKQFHHTSALQSVMRYSSKTKLIFTTCYIHVVRIIRVSLVTNCHYMSDCSVHCAAGTVNRKQVYSSIKTRHLCSKYVLC